MGWQKWIGAGACVLLVISCFMHWGYYPVLNGKYEFFTGLYSFENYYGKPGYFFCFFGTLAFIMHLLNQTWAKATNLAIAAFCTAWAGKCLYVYSSPYNGDTPELKSGIWIMAIAVVINLIAVLFAKVPESDYVDTSANDEVVKP